MHCESVFEQNMRILLHINTMQDKSASYIAGCTRTEIQTKEKREKKILEYKGDCNMEGDGR